MAEEASSLIDFNAFLGGKLTHEYAFSRLMGFHLTRYIRRLYYMNGRKFSCMSHECVAVTGIVDHRRGPSGGVDTGGWGVVFSNQ